MKTEARVKKRDARQKEMNDELMNEAEKATSGTSESNIFGIKTLCFIRS